MATKIQTSGQGGGVIATDHSLRRFRQRTNRVDITKGELEYRFEQGDRVEIDDREAYQRARQVQVDGEPFVLLSANGVIKTVLNAGEEDVCPETSESTDDAGEER